MNKSSIKIIFNYFTRINERHARLGIIYAMTANPMNSMQFSKQSRIDYKTAVHESLVKNNLVLRKGERYDDLITNIDIPRGIEHA